MRRLIIILIATVLPCSPVLADDIENVGVFGDGYYPGFVCDDCRDPYEYPMDFVAFSYNGLFSEDPWLLGSNVSWPFRIYNSDGDWVAVWFTDLLFDMPSLLPNLMTVMLRFENGRVVPYVVIQNGPDMPVGPLPAPEPESGSADCGCGDGEDGDDEYEEPEEEWEWEESERTGVVEIVDPDEDGELPDFWEEEL